MIPRCNICGFPVIKLNAGQFGYRCIRCFSTYVHRAMAYMVDEYYKGRNDQLAVYELSSRGAFFLFLKRKFRRLACSEYFDDVVPGAYRGKVQCQDVQRLTFKSDTFELVTSTEVFEHVANDRLGFREVWRVLKPGGRFIFTVPMLGNEVTIERAVLDENGEIRHLFPPEYHGDRIRGKADVLAFRNYGADIIGKLGEEGFKAELRKIWSDKHRIFFPWQGELREQLVIVANKPV